MNISSALRHAKQELENVSDAPLIDAERLLLAVLSKSEPSWLHAHGDQTLSADQQQTFKKLLASRRTGMPLAYIFGEWEFYGRPFFVNEHVLIPRPETEQLIDAALTYIREHDVQTIADIGTGSGIIAITLALEMPEVRIIATDISEHALDIAQKNAERYNVRDRIEFLQGDMLEPLGDQNIDFIVSNPPYVPSAELGAPPTPETAGLAFEPRIALDGGVDGQDFIKKITAGGIPAVVEGVGGEIERISI